MSICAGSDVCDKTTHLPHRSGGHVLVHLIGTLHEQTSGITFVIRNGPRSRDAPSGCSCLQCFRQTGCLPFVCGKLMVWGVYGANHQIYSGRQSRRVGTVGGHHRGSQSPCRHGYCS